MNVAIIGCGRIAINHLRAIINNNLDLVALCDLDIKKTDELLSRADLKLSIKKYTDYKKMLYENHNLDFVAIATDSESHAEIALFFLQNNIHVIVEKPMAMSIEAADKMIKMAEEHNVKLCVCHQNRFNIAVQKVRQAIEENKFGKLSHGSIHIRWNRGKSYYDQASWRGKWKSDGGALMNQCIHGIDLLRWMMGDEVEEVYGAIRNRFHDYLECEDIGMAVIKFKNGSIGTIEGTTNVYPKNLEETLYIFGENGTVKLGGTSCNNIDIWEFKQQSKEDEENKKIKEETSNVYGNGHTMVYRDMIDSIKNNHSPYIDGHAGKNALEIVLAIYKSQLIGKPIKLPLSNFDTISMSGFFENHSI